MLRLVTKENIERLDFVDWDRLKDVVSNGFDDGDVSKFRPAATLAQWVQVVLTQILDVKQTEVTK